MNTKKPYDFTYYAQVLQKADLNKLLATAIALGCLGGLVSGKLGQRDLSWLLIGAGIGATVVARGSVATAEQTRLVLNDYEDISAAVRTNQEFKDLSEAAPEIPEYNWEMLVKSGLPVYVLGDREESLQVAEWLAWKSSGVSVFVSDVPEDIKVTQHITPGKDEYAASLAQILSYAYSPSYEGIINALNDELDQRRTHSAQVSLSAASNLYDLNVVLDNPPSVPDTRGAISMNMYYIMLGKAATGWQEVLVGSEAYLYAQKQSSLQYGRELLRRWDAGESPVLVNKQYARLPQL